MKKVLLLCTLTFFASTLFALDLTFRATPQVSIPAKDSGLGLGFGGIANADLDLFNFATIGIEGGYNTLKQNSLEKNYGLIMGGAGLGLYFYPLSRLYLSANGSVGIYNVSIDAPSVTDNANGIYYRGYGELGFRFSPGFLINAVGGYEVFTLENQPFLSSPFVGLSAKFNVSAGKKSSGGFAVSFSQDSVAYPVYANLYKTTQLGTATVRNMSGAEARDVHISFRAGRYTAAEKECAHYFVLNRYSSVEIPVFADFGPEFLRFSEDGKINGELVITYKFLGKKCTEVQNIVIDVKHRNSFTWNDSAALASFIDSGTPEILEAAKFIAGTEIINLKPGMNSPLQYAAAIMEGLRLAGIIYSEDTLSPYTTYRTNGKTDSVQYPLQTLSLLSGDYDDIGILVCSCLESFGIGTGFVALPDDFIVLVDTNISPEKKTNQFAAEDVISDENTTWLPLSMKEFANGFTQSRLSGAKKVHSVFKAQEKAKSEGTAEADEYTIVDVHTAWEYYPPVTFSGYRGSYKNPSKDAIIKAVNEDTKYYINNDLAALIKKFRNAGDTKRLADCYVRAGMYNEAIAEYQKLNTVSAWNNLGMVYSSQKSYKSARAMYEKVLAKDPQNKTALAGINKIKALTGE